MTIDQGSPSNEMEKMIYKLNEDLIHAGAEGAEQAFGLLTWLGALPLVALIIFLLAFKIINLIMPFLLAIFCSLIFLALTSLVAQRARENSIRQFYANTIRPQINQIQTDYQLSPVEVFSQARDILPEHAPLLEHLRNSLEIIHGDRPNE